CPGGPRRKGFGWRRSRLSPGRAAGSTSPATTMRRPSPAIGMPTRKRSACPFHLCVRSRCRTTPPLMRRSPGRC
ncbi:MAG: hypothetical protein AVDCRST_MAG05-5272, partial [uncultured Rubrobacteraceae bacterium]